MKVLFLNLPYKYKISRTSRWPEKTKSGTLYYPFWLAYAAGAAEQAGLEINLIDAIAKKFDSKTTWKTILAWKPDLIVAEITTPTVNDDLEFFKLGRKLGYNKKILLTGTHATVFAKQLLKNNSHIDFIGIGEYDFLAPEIMKNINDLQKVDGLAWRNNENIVINKHREPLRNLDELPFVSRVYKKFLNINDYCYSLAQHPMIQILSSRGCPCRCNFCSFPQTMEGRQYRTRSPENFVNELEYIAKEIPQIKEIFIEDDTFSIDKNRVKKICELIMAKDLKIKWSVNVRADIDLDTMQKMKSAGCRLLVVGYESGDQEILNNAKKGIIIEQSLAFAKNAKEAGLKVFGCFMIGLAGETEETTKKTFLLAKKTKPDMVFFQQAVPFPGTEFYNWAKDNNYLLTNDFSKWLNDQGQLNFLVNYPKLSAREMIKLRDKFMLKYYFSPCYFWSVLTGNNNKEEIKRIIKSGVKYVKFLMFKKYARIQR
ncbi:radical SAM protein [Candidatus Parcubacteria bacterium]|nr:radical SAM protein [Candidatus Parcubacteria bacterium]